VRENLRWRTLGSVDPKPAVTTQQIAFTTHINNYTKNSRSQPINTKNKSESFTKIFSHKYILDDSFQPSPETPL